MNKYPKKCVFLFFLTCNIHIGKKNINLKNICILPWNMMFMIHNDIIRITSRFTREIRAVWGDIWLMFNMSVQSKQDLSQNKQHESANQLPSCRCWRYDVLIKLHSREQTYWLSFLSRMNYVTFCNVHNSKHPLRSPRTYRCKNGTTMTSQSWAHYHLVTCPELTS